MQILGLVELDSASQVDPLRQMGANTDLSEDNT
jgi:hypothetical protein